MEKLWYIFIIISLSVSWAVAGMEMPKFSQLKLLYPGYHHYGGDYHPKDLMNLIGGSTRPNLHNTSPLRISKMLNQFGGRHSIGKDPIRLSKIGQDSYTGKDGIQYIFRIVAFGPFLSSRYGNPQVAMPNKWDPKKTMDPFHGKQGIVLLVSYHHHTSGHIALWDCDHFHQSRDWSLEHDVIAVHLWESPDSYCPPKRLSTPKPHLQHIRPWTYKPAAGQLPYRLYKKRRGHRKRHHQLMKKLDLNKH